MPPCSSRRFHPTIKDVRNHMYKAAVKLRFAKLDQANLDIKIQEWKKQYPNDNFFFRSYGKPVKDAETEFEKLNNDLQPESGKEVEDEFIQVYFIYFFLLLIQNAIDYIQIFILYYQVKELKTEQRLLFVHQTSTQRHLLKRYGNHICLLDATYKTTKYSIPLFFVALRTNVDYQIVGSFAIQD